MPYVIHAFLLFGKLSYKKVELQESDNSFDNSSMPHFKIVIGNNQGSLVHIKRNNGKNN